MPELTEQEKAIVRVALNNRIQHLAETLRGCCDVGGRQYYEGMIASTKAVYEKFARDGR